VVTTRISLRAADASEAARNRTEYGSGWPTGRYCAAPEPTGPMSVASDPDAPESLKNREKSGGSTASRLGSGLG
jgi:hypothetical protein